MKETESSGLIDLNMDASIWQQFFMVMPLVIIGTKEGERYDLAPKHMVTPLGSDNYFGFVCTPAHSTYHNVKKEQRFTVSFPKPDQVVLASLASSPRCNTKHDKAIVPHLPTFKSEKTDALFVRDAYLYLDCKLFKITEGFGNYCLISGEVVGAQVDKNYALHSDSDEQQMFLNAPLLAYLPPGRFAEIKRTNAFPFPKGFNW